MMNSAAFPAPAFPERLTAGLTIACVPATKTSQRSERGISLWDDASLVRHIFVGASGQIRRCGSGSQRERHNFTLQCDLQYFVHGSSEVQLHIFSDILRDVH